MQGLGKLHSAPCLHLGPQRDPVPKGDSSEPAEGRDVPRRKKRSGRRSEGANAEADSSKAEALSIDNFNPVVMGRKSRRIFDDVWQQFTKLSGPVGSSALDDVFNRMAAGKDEFETPQAAVTRVLVAGATGRVGRVLVRKLLLRGYKVKALAREHGGQDNAKPLPPAVEVVTGDVGDEAACLRAVQGVDKVVFCAAARTPLTVDVRRVEELGVANLASALQNWKHVQAQKAGMVQRTAKRTLNWKHVQAQKAGTVQRTAKRTLADDSRFETAWSVEHVGAGAEERTETWGSMVKKRYQPPVRDRALTSLNDRRNLIFEGEVHSRGGYAQVGTQLRPEDAEALAGCEGLVLRLAGDGQAYSVLLTTDDGTAYSARMTVPIAFTNLRVPFSAFRPASYFAFDSDAPDLPALLDPARVASLSLRYEPARRSLPAVLMPGESGSASGGNAGSPFRLEIDRIKALPGGDEADFILVSCAGAGAGAGDDSGVAGGNGVMRPATSVALAAKRRGEAALRNCGLGYTVVRPGPLMEEPGGYKALVFDQGERITQGISCADVADICLKALHDPVARNKTFEVCYEYTPEAGLEMYELVAHLPDKANNYLGPALAVLEKNT
ncbi:hypothetical protein WJX81_005781 [Elliptochloris bilobata]|uniref:NAD(P)-binding domain-containing protein n=1 Tax=Elliptochloris bilobata TaxID=381761 RepID=A0AAW1SC87_9CHLO